MQKIIFALWIEMKHQTTVFDWQLTEKLQSKPKGYYAGVIPVDFAGYPIDLEKLKDICKEFDLWIIEDACHAPGGFFTDTSGSQHP